MNVWVRALVLEVKILVLGVTIIFAFIGFHSMLKLVLGASDDGAAALMGLLIGGYLFCLPFVMD